MIFRKQFQPYPDNIPANRRKSLTIQGQSIPMRMIVERYASGQLFGISQIPQEYDEELDEENHIMIDYDPVDPLYAERASILHKKISSQIEKHVEDVKKQKESSTVEDSN